MMKLRILRWGGDPALSGWAQLITRVLKIWEKEADSESQRERLEDAILLALEM